MFADACVIGLRLSGWAAVTLLAALGCFVLLFLMLGNFEAAGFFSHLDNLARRFAEADAARRSHFLTLVGWVSVALVLVVTACRMRSLLAVFRLSPGVSHA
ncbi:MAG: hypothetical protein ABWZ85_02570 [Luteibacter sp.]